jgi:hypothetical protein
MVNNSQSQTVIADDRKTQFYIKSNFGDRKSLPNFSLGSFKQNRKDSNLEVYFTEGGKNTFIDVNSSESFRILFKESETEVWQGLSVTKIALNVKLCFSVISDYSLRLRIVDHVPKKFEF